MKQFALIGAVISVIALIAGCSGGGRVLSGRASIAIEWPEPSRLIPKAANFVRVRAFTSTDTPIGSQPPAVSRPVPPASSTTTINIDNLPVGENITFRAEAFAQNPDAVGGQIPQASGQQTLLIRNDAPNTFDISMASTVSQVTFERNGAPIAGTLDLIAGEDANITAQARTPAPGNALVLVDPNNWSWTSGNANLKVNSTSTATGPTVVVRGQATVTAALNIMETESNIPGSLNVQVVQPLYPGAVNGNIAGDATGFGDVGSGPMDTRAPGDRVFALITRMDPLGKFSRREVDIHDSETMAIVGNFVPTFVNTPPSLIVRNSTGIAIAYEPEISPPSSASVINWRDTGAIRWTSSGLDSLSILDISARVGHTYVMQDGPGVGFRITKLRDSDGRIVKQMLAPNGTPPTADDMTVDDEENIYIATGDAAPWVIKMDKNGDQQPFNVTSIPFVNIIDIDFDQGLVYVLDEAADATRIGTVFIFGQSGSHVQTVAVPRIGPNESARRMSVFRGQIFVISDDRPTGFRIRKISR